MTARGLVLQHRRFCRAALHQPQPSRAEDGLSSSFVGQRRIQHSSCFVLSAGVHSHLPIQRTVHEALRAIGG